jgi:hypothetical protein
MTTPVRWKMRCKKEFMDVARPTKAAAMERAIDYLVGLGRLPPRNSLSVAARPDKLVAMLRSACDSMQFSTEACRIPLYIPLRNTVPVRGTQYVLGRVDTLDINGYNNLDSPCMKVLNLGYESTRPGEVTWDIFINDLFIACSASKTYAFGQFPVRLVVDPLVHAPPRAGAQIKRFHQLDEAGRRYDAANAVARFGMRNYRSRGLPTVTVREMCQLIHVFGMHMYKYIGPDWGGQYDLYFFSHAKQVPPKYRSLYVEAKLAG